MDKYKFASEKIKQKKKLCDLQKELASLLRYNNIDYNTLAPLIFCSTAKIYYVLQGKGALKKSDIEQLIKSNWSNDITKVLQKMLECYKTY